MGRIEAKMRQRGCSQSAIDRCEFGPGRVADLWPEHVRLLVNCQVGSRFVDKMERGYGQCGQGGMDIVKAIDSEWHLLKTGADIDDSMDAYKFAHSNLGGPERGVEAAQSMWMAEWVGLE